VSAKKQKPVCGTVNAYLRHRRENPPEECAECKAAWNAYYKEYRIKKKVQAYRDGLLAGGDSRLRPDSQHLKDKVDAYELALRESSGMLVAAEKKLSPPKAYVPPAKVTKVTLL
jgi:hypothetical protein